MTSDSPFVLRTGQALALLLALACLAPAEAQEPDARPADPTWLGGQIYQENDSLIAGDERYTQGLRISLVKREPPAFAKRLNEKLSGWLWSDTLLFHPRFSVVFGQNMYTPEIITAPDPYPGDRGFAGVLYGGAQLQFTEEGQTRRHTFEAYVGLTGRPSLAEPAQKGLHVLRFRRIPKGWGSAEDGVVANAYYRYERRLGCSSDRTCFADVTLGGLGALGNIQTTAGLHVAARVGYGLTGFPAAAIANALAPLERRTLEIGAILGWEGRAVAYNGLLVPSDPTTDFSAEAIVRDTRYGGYVRFKDVRVTALAVKRSPEFSVPGSPKREQTFASLSLSYEPMEVSARGLPRFLLRDWHFDLGLGRAVVGPRLDQGDRPRGPAGRIGLAKGLLWDLLIGFELGGTVVEYEPPTDQPDSHNDTFLIHRALTLGWKPRFAKGRLILRAGPTLFGQVGKVETTDNHLEHGKPVEELRAEYHYGGRWGWMGGADFWFPLEEHLLLGVGVTYSHLGFEDKVPGVAKAEFATAELAIQVRP